MARLVPEHLLVSGVLDAAMFRLAIWSYLLSIASNRGLLRSIPSLADLGGLAGQIGPWSIRGVLLQVALPSEMILSAFP